MTRSMARRLAQTPVPDVVEEAPRERAAARGAHAVVTVLMLLGCAQVLFLLGVEGLRYVRARQDVGRLEQQVAVLEGQRAELQAVADHASDAAYRESLARLQGYMFPDEVRAVGPGAPTTPPEPRPLPERAEPSRPSSSEEPSGP